MKRDIRPLLYLAALVVVLGTGLVHAMWIGRWRSPQVLRDAAARLGHAPEDLGEWKARPAEIDAEVLASAGAVGSWVRSYRHEGSGETLTILLLCGNGGPMSVHRPEHCYRAAGYDMTSAITPFTLKSEAGVPLAEFRTATFSKPVTEGGVPLRILWSWYADGAWRAPESPRLSLARHPVLYKLYVVHATARPRTRPEEDPATAFLQILLPELNKVLAFPDR
jgi:hypothetical protein